MNRWYFQVSIRMKREDDRGLFVYVFVCFFSFLIHYIIFECILISLLVN